MGAKQCSLRQQNPEPLPKQDGSDDQLVCARMSIIVELIKPGCLKTEMKKRQLQPKEKKITKVRKSTLEECILASPSLKQDNIKGGELHVLKHFSSRVYPSSTRVHAGITSKPRDSFSKERLVEVYEDATKADLAVSSLSRSQSGKMKKKVSFRMPVEADVIIFYSP